MKVQVDVKAYGGTDRRCDCEAEGCTSHPAGGCTNPATLSVRMYGMRILVCARCLPAYLS